MLLICLLILFKYFTFFYENFQSNQYIIVEDILSFFRDNSFLVGGCATIITGIFWFHKLLREKRAEAFFGFYARLLIRTKTLRKLLEERGQLNIENPKSGNIYSLYYDSSIRGSIGYAVLSEKELNPILKAAEELKNILITSDCNVYPVNANREKWYSSQSTLFSFFEFLNSPVYHGKVNKLRSEGDPLHISKCKELIKAMDYIQEAIEREGY